MVIYLNDDSIYSKGRKFYTQALDSIAESLSNDGFGRFVTWFILWITWQNVPMDRGELVASVSGDTTWIESLCVKSFFHSCELNRRFFFFLNSIVLLLWARGSLDSLFVCLFFFLKKGEGGGGFLCNDAGLIDEIRFFYIPSFKKAVRKGQLRYFLKLILASEALGNRPWLMYSLPIPSNKIFPTIF